MKMVEYGCERKEVALLLHGGGLSWWNYQGVAELLKERFHVVIPILDGHSESDAPFESVEKTAKTILRVIDERFGGRVVFMGGLSLGGQILTEILSQREDVCQYAILESALITPMPMTERWIAPSFSLCYPLIKKRWFAKLQFQSLGIKKSLFERYYQDSVAIKKEDLIAFTRANFSYVVKDSLSNAKAKILVVAGGRELAAIKRSAKLLAQRIQDAELEIIPKYKHGDLSINHEEEYAKRVFALIES